MPQHWDVIGDNVDAILQVSAAPDLIAAGVVLDHALVKAVSEPQLGGMRGHCLCGWTTPLAVREEQIPRSHALHLARALLDMMHSGWRRPTP